MARLPPGRLRDWIAARIGRRIAAAYLVVALLVILAATLLGWFMALSLEREHFEARLDSYAEMGAERLAEHARTAVSQLRALAGSPVVAAALVDAEPGDPAAAHLLRGFQPGGVVPRSLCLTDYQGASIACLDAAPRRMDGRRWAGAVVGQARASAEILDEAEGPVLALAVPVVYRATGRPEGMLVASFELTELLGHATDMLPPDWLAHLVQGGRRVVDLHPDDASRAFRRRPVMMPDPLDGLGLGVEVGALPQVAAGPLLRLHLIFIGGFALLGLAAVPLSARLARGASARITRLAGQAADAAERGSFDFQPLPGRDEVAELSRAFGRMVDRLREAKDGLEAQVEERTRELSEARERLRLSEERLALGFEGSGDGLWDWDCVTGRCHYSRRWKEMLGHAEDEVGDALEEWASRVHPDDLQRAMEAVRGHADGETATYRAEFRMRCKDGGYRWIMARGRAVGRDAAGRALRVVGTHTDITERKLAEQAQALARLAFTTVSEGIMITDADKHIISVNPAFEAITGYAEAEVLGRDPRLLASGLQDQAAFERMYQGLAAEGRWVGELWNRRKSGELYAQRTAIATVSEGGRVSRYLAVLSDVTEQKRATEALRHVADHDTLTGLANRRRAVEQLHGALARARRQGGHFALLMIDLDGFKEVNDSLGHAAGDKVLCAVASRVADAVRGSDMVARLGGDEFVVLLDGGAGAAEVEAVARKVIHAVSEPQRFGSTEVRVSASVGAAIYPQDGADVQTLLARADAAMYQAKAAGKGVCCLASEDYGGQGRDPHTLVADLHAALERGALELHYQPIVDLSGGELLGAEALLRWRDPDAGLRSAADFLPLVADEGLVKALDDWTLAEAAAQLGRWRPLLGARFRLGINLSAGFLTRPDCAGRLLGVLESSGADASRLALELNEATLAEQHRPAVETLRQLDRAGPQLVVDGFGAQGARIEVLRHAPVRALKVCHRLVQGLGAPGPAPDLLRAIVSAAAALGVEASAEGVETRSQAEALVELGLRAGQGNYVAPPMPASDFERTFLPRGGSRSADLRLVN